MLAEPQAALKPEQLKLAVQAGTIGRNQRPDPMTALAFPDLAACAWFLSAWIVYSIVIEKSAKGRTSLNSLMNDYRDEWMERLLERDMRMVDAQVTAALQNGTAFFASTSLIAIGGALTLLRSSDEIMTVMSLLPLGTTPSRGLWDLKMMGLIIIFVYAFFKFAWSYRLFNYFAIMVGAAPLPAEKDTPRPKFSRTGQQGFARTRAAISIAASAPFSSHSAIWAGFSARCRLRYRPPAFWSSCGSGNLLPMHAKRLKRISPDQWPRRRSSAASSHPHQDGDSAYDQHRE